MSIGRVGLASAGGDALSWPSPTGWDQSGTTITLSGLVHGLSTTDLVFWREQVLALGQTEQVVPLAVSERAELDGWYRVLGAQVDAPGGSVGGYNALPWTIQVERPADWRSPRWETTHVFGQRASTIAPTSSWSTSIPGAAETRWDAPSIDGKTVLSGLTTDTQPTADGNLAFLFEGTPSSATAGTSTSRWQLSSVADHYVGSARIEANVGGTWRALQGMTCPVDPALVRLSNGWCRITPSGTAFTVELYDGGWVTSRTMTLSASAGVASITPTIATVVENTPARCIVRLVGRLSTGTVGALRFVTDLTLARGGSTVAISTSHASSVAPQLSVAATGASVATGAIAASSADGAGNKWLIIAKDTPAASSTVSPAYVRASAGTSAGFAVGHERGGSASWTAAGIRNYYFHSATELVRPVVV